MQIGGIHRSFETVARILDRVEEIGGDRREYMSEFNFKLENGFYAFSERTGDREPPRFGLHSHRLSVIESVHFRFMKNFHHHFFNTQSPLAPYLRRFCQTLDRYRCGRMLATFIEGAIKKLLLDCQKCGDCGIQHVAFLCPESKCPKNIRNGACGGSSNGRCEVHPTRKCVWVRAYQRWAAANRLNDMTAGCVPPRMWELDNTPSWVNFHLKRDHNSLSTRIAQFCHSRTCRLPEDFSKSKS